MKKALRFVDSFIRGRGEIIERVKTGERLGRFIAGAALMYVVFPAVYGVGMGSFRWAHPLLFFSDYAMEEGGTGLVDAMDADTGSFSTRDLKAAPDLVGRTIRFNQTNPTPPYAITRTEQFGPHCRVYVEGPPMVAEDPWMFALASSLKVPALFLVTLLVCLPALYVLNVLTDHYHFMMVLHVLIFTLAGAYGVQTLGVGLNGLRQDIQPSQAEKPNRKRLIVAWLLLYMFVGCQMAWSLRPWVGTPYIAEFEALRPASSNFYVNVVGSFGKLGDTRR